MPAGCRRYPIAMPVLENPRHEKFAGDSRFYVYELVDPRDGSVFYVGKGTGKRDRSHLSEARRRDFRNPAKVALILQIEAEGHEVIVRRVYEGLSEREAFKAERRQIAHYGIANLTNMMRGFTTENDRAEAEAIDGLNIMAYHLTRLFRGASYSVSDIKMILRIIRELRESLALIRASA